MAAWVDAAADEFAQASDELKATEAEIRKLKARLDELFALQKSQYERYREARENMREWQAIRQNIDHLFDRNRSEEKHRGISRY